jgi:hypothetical protein
LRPTIEKSPGIAAGALTFATASTDRSVMPAHSRLKNGVASLAYGRGHPDKGRTVPA